MKKTYRLTIDYEIEINEKVQAYGEYSRELGVKTQHIINAFFQCPEVLLDFVKNRLFNFLLYGDPKGHYMAESLDIKKEEVFMRNLSRYLPTGTVPYLLELFGYEENNSISNEDLEEGLGLLLEQFSKPIPLHASFKEIRDANGISPVEEKQFPGLENCKLVQSIIELFHQGARFA